VTTAYGRRGLGRDREGKRLRRFVHGRVGPWLAATALLGALAGCGMFDREKRPGACPRFLILGGADEVTKFRPGTGRDVTDVAFRASVADFNGTCGYDKDSVKVTLNVVFEIERGPASTARDAAFQYFVAIPQFHPDPAGKQVFPVSARFEGAAPQLVFVDALAMTIPIKDKQLGADYEVYLGFQLTPDEIEWNRTHKR
jgi:hypothetical protein